MYGDDCNPSTNYPLLRLRNTHTGQVFFARTYDFSTRGITIGATSQSVRFSAAHIPYGQYELCAIANGISSHCVTFVHRHPVGDDRCGECCQPAAGCCCGKKHARDGDQEEPVLKPEIVALSGEVHRLSRALDRLDSRVAVEEPHQERKEVKRQEEGA
jgi:hypothetical protein